LTGVNYLFVAKTHSATAVALAQLDNEFFVLKKSSLQLNVFDAISFTLRGSMTIPNVFYVCNFVDMVACSFHNCLYIANAQSGCIIRLEMPSACKQWEVEGFQGNDAVISVTSSHHVLVVCDRSDKLRLFSTNGVLHKTVKLPSDLVNVTSAVELIPDQYVVTHGRFTAGLHRVCVINGEGKMLHTFGGFQGSHPKLLNSPSDVVVDKDGFVYVDDEGNNRLIVLTQELDYIHCMSSIFKTSDYCVRRRMKLNKQLGFIYVSHTEYQGNSSTWYTTMFKI